jgi:ectoine hydroxylase-related dioxygenase (phytanoyl-CoA dioxygenase family)
MSTTAQAAPALVVDPATIAAYRRDGFAVLRGVLTPAEVAHYRAASLAVTEVPPSAQRASGSAYSRAFTQVVNIWRTNDTLKQLTFHPRVVAAMRQFTGVPMRLWHDHILTKAPRNGQASEFHQDQPYWPLGREMRAISAWMALGDTPVEHGCMSFIPGSHQLRNIPRQSLTDATSLMGLCPELTYAPRVTIPLRAGDITFHDGFTAHFAGANQLEVPRVAHVVIAIEASARFQGGGHVVTDPLGLRPGDALPESVCPGI